MRRLASVLSVSLVGFAVVSAPITGRALQEKRDFHISASGPRALADALFDLGRENNWVITYEDRSEEHTSELQSH